MKAWMKRTLALLAALCLLPVSAALGEALTEPLYELPVPEAEGAELWTDDMLRAQTEAAAKADPAVAAPGGVGVDAEHFPDAAFRQLVSEAFDADGDGVLSQEEIEGVTLISARNKGIADLTGVELFPNLKDLDVMGNQLTRLDASNVKIGLNCADNRLTELITPKAITLETLVCSGNQLEALDLSDNNHYSLLTLHCQDNRIQTLDLSTCPGVLATVAQPARFDRQTSEDGKVISIYDRTTISDSGGNVIVDFGEYPAFCFDAAMTVTDGTEVVYAPSQGQPAGPVEPMLLQLSLDGELLPLYPAAGMLVCYGYPRRVEPVLFPEEAVTSFSWSSTNPAVATVEDGLITGLANGEADILVTTGNGLVSGVTVEVFSAPEAAAAPQPTAAPSATAAPQPTVAPTATIGEAAWMFTDSTGTYEVIGTKVTFVAPAKSASTVKVPDTVITRGQKLKVTAIADKAFYKARNLTAVTIGKYVKKIGAKAFYGCGKLKKITIRTAKLTGKTVGANAFKGLYAKAVFKCPKAKLKAYKALFRKKGAPKKAKYR